MFGFFKSEAFTDPTLGALERSRGLWRGSMVLGDGVVPLMTSGSRSAPDSNALAIARSLPANVETWRPIIERELFEHYSSYAESVAAGEDEAPESGLPTIHAASDVWPHVTTEYVSVTPLDGELTVEIAYRVAWDEEHTLGARFRGGKLLELCGSVLAP